MLLLEPVCIVKDVVCETMEQSTNKDSIVVVVDAAILIYIIILLLWGQ